MVLDDAFNDFLKASSWWLALIFVGLIVIAVIAIFLSGRGKKKIQPEPKLIDKNAYLTALGGENNVVGKKLMGSRIVLVLKDYQKIDQAKLKEAGVDSFIQMSDKLTLVIKDGADEVYRSIFEQKQ